MMKFNKTTLIQKRILTVILMFVCMFSLFATSETKKVEAAAPTTYTDAYDGGSYSVTSSKYFRFIPTQSGVYQFYSSNNSGDPYGYLYDSNGNQIASNDDGNGGRNFLIEFECYKNTTYYFRCAYYSSGSGSYTFNIRFSYASVENTTAAIESLPGTNSYALFNSGCTSSSGKYYNSSSNPNDRSLTNNGYDIYATASSSTIRTVDLGLSIKINSAVTERATLTIKAYDVDENSGERDIIYLVDDTTGTRRELSGYLSGRDSQWNTTTMFIDGSLFEVGHSYHFQLYEKVSGWVVWVRTVSLLLTTDGEIDTPIDTPQITNHTFSGSISNNGLVTTNLYLESNMDFPLTLEYKAVINGEQTGGALNQPITATQNGVSKTVTFQLESGSPKGTYTITVYLKDANGNDLYSYFFNAGYSYYAVSYSPNGGSNNLPIDNNQYVSGNTVNVLFDYIPSKRGYEFLGWSRNANATTPEFTQDGVKQFTISSSDVVLYAVWSDPHEHVAGEWIIDVAPTCQSTGSKHKECTTCHEVLETAVMPFAGHSFVQTAFADPTCTVDGYVDYVCNTPGCNATKHQVIYAEGHRYGDDNVCDICGESFEVHEHDYLVVEVPATCQSVGYTVYTCSCGHTYRANYIEQLGHKWGEGVVTVAPTCTTDGEKTYTCSECQAVNIVKIEAAHTWTEVSRVEKTCTTNGSISKECSVCHATEVEVIPAGHEWNEGTPVIEATCTEPGVQRCTCTVCGLTSDLAVAKLGHHMVNGVCTRCGAIIPDIVTPDDDHLEYGMYFDVDDIISDYGPDYINEYGVLLDYNSDARLKKVAVYLTQDGTMWRRCIAVVGENISYATYVPYLSYNEEIKYTGLNSAWINTFKLSPNSDGIWCYSNYTTIGVNLQDAQGNLLLSLYDIGQAGAKTRIFTNLEEMINWLKEDSDCINHTPGEWIVDAEATCCEDGSKHALCTICGLLAKVEVIPATGAIESGWIVDSNPTCVDNGAQHKECTLCHKVLVQEVIYATGIHTPSEWIVDLEATCCENGAQHKDCTVCSARVEDAVISATGTIESEWIIDVEAICIVDGAKHKECLGCHRVLVEEVIPATGFHPESEWIIDISATATTQGLKHKECTQCHEQLITEIIPLAATIKVEDTTAKPGDFVSVSVDISNNPGVLGAVLTLSYPAELELVDVKAGGAWSYLNLTYPAGFESPCNFVWDGMYGNDTSNGSIIVLTFKVSKDAVVNNVYDIELTYSAGNVVDENYQNVDLVIENGSITIAHLQGDVNADGVVDVADVITLRRYLADAEGYGVTIDMELSDMNGDTVITVADLIMLRRHIVNE